MKVLFVYSGKGGVGKSTVSVNLAYALKQKGYTVGIFDADLHTPSVSRLISGLPLERRIKINHFSIQPAIYDGLLVSSTGLINNDEEGIIWDEWYDIGALSQFLNHKWPVDYLIIDMPPGTNRIHRELCKQFPEANTLLVITPSTLSIDDTLKAAYMLKKLQMRILGTVLNMGEFICSNCNGETMLLISRQTDYQSIEFVRESSFFLHIPFSGEVMSANEEGIPICKSCPSHPITDKFSELADNVIRCFNAS